MNQPLTYLAVLYSAGLVLGYFLPVPMLPAFAAVGALGVAAFVWARARRWLLYGGVFLFAWLNYTAATAVLSPHDLRTVIGDSRELVDIRGRLAEAPVERVSVHDDGESWRTIAELNVTSVRIREGEWRPAYGRVLTTTSSVLPQRFSLGQPVQVRGVLVRPDVPTLSGVFNYRRYLEQRGVYYQLKVASADHWEIDGETIPLPWSRRFLGWAQQVLARGMPVQDEALRLQWAMLLGWQTALTAEVSEPFMRSGTMHIFAISGLHIAMIAGIFVALFRAAAVSRAISGLIIIPIIWFYTAATGWQPSAVRSTVMMTVIIVGWVLSRPSNLLNSLGVAGLIILVYDPQQLFQASFQLSFFVVLSIALLLPRLEGFGSRLLPHEPFLPMTLRPAWQRGAFWAVDRTWKAFAVSLAATIGSLPLIAYYFHLLTPGSLFANLLVVPASGAALASGLGALLTAGFAPGLAECFNHGGWLFMRLMVWLSECAAALPGSWMHVRSPSLIEFLFYYGALVVGLAGGFRVPRWRVLFAVNFAGLAVVSVATQIAWWRSAEVSVLPLAGTHSVVSRPEYSTRYSLINCGHRDVFARLLKPVLASRGIDSLEHVVLARGDVRHSSGMTEVQQLFPASAISAAPHRSRSRPYRAMLDQFAAGGLLRLDATNGARVDRWQVLHPDRADNFSRNQEHAVSLLGSFGGVRILVLTGLGTAGQDALFSRHPDLPADIIIAGLPDSGAPLALELIERIKPRLIIVADSESPASRRAPEPVRERFRSAHPPVVFTSDTGEVTLRLRNGAWKLTTVRETL